jgi:RNA polymerase sigma factor (sigma-70 family)
MEDSSAARTSVSLLGRLGDNPADAAAWETFLARYGPKIMSWCRQWKLQEADAEDVTQNVLLRVSQQMRTFRYDPSRSFRAWLKTIARRAWSDWAAAGRRSTAGSGDSDVMELLATVEAGDDLERRLEEEYERELLEAAAARVRLRVEPKTWEAFCLLARDGLSGAEAAARLDMKIGAVFVAKNRVQKMLREEIAVLEPEDSS